MITSWKSAALRELFETGHSRRVDQKLQKRALARLEALNRAKDLRDLHLPGYELHKWEGYTARWSISVSGHWRILFDWINGEARNVDLAQPHG
jgi:toxin HigB-1